MGAKPIDSDYEAAFKHLLRCARGVLRTKDTHQGSGKYKTRHKYIPDEKTLVRVGHQLSAAHAIAELSGCWREPIDTTELKALDNKLVEAWEKRLRFIEAQPKGTHHG